VGWWATEIKGNGNGNADCFHASSNVVAFRAVVWEPTLPRPPRNQRNRVEPRHAWLLLPSASDHLSGAAGGQPL